MKQIFFRSIQIIRIPLLLLGGFSITISEPSGYAAFPEMNGVHSVSGQFVVRSAGDLLAVDVDKPDPGEMQVALTPDVVAVSAERIKREYLRILGIRDDWRSKIFLTINPDKPEEEPLVVAANRFRDAWGYQIELPSRMEQLRFVRLIVGALLQEQANRHASLHSAVVPLWLKEGLAEYLLTDLPRDLLLQPKTAEVFTARRVDPLMDVRRAMAEESPLTFNELSFPGKTLDTPEGWERFQNSAHLFVHKLLELESGADSLVRMIDRMGRVLNWQTAFLEALDGHFDSLLAVEKWWALAAFKFNTIDSLQELRPEVVLTRFNEILRVESSLRESEDETPQVTYLSLQEMIRQTSFDDHRESIENIIGQLTLLMSRCGPDFYSLIQQYRQVLSSYLERRSTAGVASTRKGKLYSSIRVVEDSTISRLDRLDAELTVIRSRIKSQLPETSEDQTAALTPSKPE